MEMIETLFAMRLLKVNSIAIFVFAMLPSYGQDTIAGRDDNRIIEQLEAHISTWDKIDDNFSVIRKIIDTCDPLETSHRVKPILNKILYFYYAIDSNYATSDRLYKLRYHLEDSLEALAFSKLHEFRTVSIRACVYIKNSSELIANNYRNPDFEYLLCVSLHHNYKAYRHARSEKAFQKLETEGRKNIHMARDILSAALRLNESNVVVDQGGQVTHFKDRFVARINEQIELDFWYLLHIWRKFVTQYPSRSEVNLLKSMERNEFISYQNERSTQIDRGYLAELISDFEKSLSTQK